MNKKNNYGLCLDEFSRNKNLANIFFKRAIGKYPEMESSKAMAKILKKFIRKNDKILDVGCGCGHYYRSIKKIEKKPFFYTGVDPYSIFIKRAKIAWNDEKKANFKIGNIFDLPFKKKEFDIVFCSNVFMHLPDIKIPIKELLRVTKKYLIIRTSIHDKSYRVQVVYNKNWWKYTQIEPKEEFDKFGRPRSFSYTNVYSEAYFRSVVNKFHKKNEIKIFKDNDFNSKSIQKSFKKEKRPSATRIVNGMPVSDLLIFPSKFAIVKKK